MILKTNERPMMQYPEFIHYVNSLPSERPVILLEGKRDVREEDKPLLVRLGAQLAKEFSQCLFRSGNAAGADDLFVQGVAQVDPGRIQLVLPNRGHGKQRIPGNARVYSLDSVDMVHEEEVIYHVPMVNQAIFFSWLSTGGHFSILDKHVAFDEKMSIVEK